MIDVEGRTYLVGGASRGIGLATSNLLLELGATVIAVARNPNELKKSFAAQQRIVPICADLTNQAWLRQLHEGSKIGPIDGVIMVAGSGRPTKKFDAVSSFTEAVRLNVTPILATVPQLAPLLITAETSSITIVTSIAGSEFIDAPVEYSMAKSCLRALVKHWSWEKRPVRVNALTPGNVLTESSVWNEKSQNDRGNLNQWLEANVAQARLGSPEEIARSLVFLASPSASFITGSNLTVDGGQMRSW